MIDLAQLSTIDLKHLSEEEADLWCERILKFAPVSSESREQILSLFDFTRSLLRLKTIQTDVLIEELQTVGTRLDAVNQELDEIKSSPQELGPSVSSTFASKTSEGEVIRLQGALENKEDELEELKEKSRRTEESLRQKDREVASLRVELETVQQELRENATRPGVSRPQEMDLSPGGAEQIEEQKQKLAEKNSQIEQLLDRLYDSDRINLDLAEQLAKHRLEGAKLGNDLKIAQSKVEMLTVQVDEFRRLNESLIQDRNRKEREIVDLRSELEQRSSALLRPVTGDSSSRSSPTPSVDVATNFVQELSNEIQRLNRLLEVKEREINELRSTLTQLSASDRSIMERKREEIERLEEELAIVSTSPKPGEEETVTEATASLLTQQLRQRIRKLRQEKLSLLERVSELEKEATSKDADLERARRRSLNFLVNGDTSGGGGTSSVASSVKSLLEENAVLSRMIKFRDEKIHTLIDRLNQGNLSNGTEGKNGYSLTSSLLPGTVQSEIQLMDRLNALAVERDVLLKQLDGVKFELKSAAEENTELQLAMKEILEVIKRGDANSDHVIECPSLERVCVLLENRRLFTEATESTIASASVDLSTVFLLKSELDFVRGQNEQLRSEMKQLRLDSQSIIDEYNEYYLKYGTIASSPDDSFSDSMAQAGASKLPDTSASTLESASQTLENENSLETGSQTFDLPEDGAKVDLLQAYYQQLQRFQSKRKAVPKKRSKRPSPVPRERVSGQSSRPKAKELNTSETQTDEMSTILPESPKDAPKSKYQTSDQSIQTDSELTTKTARESALTSSDQLNEGQIKEALFQNSQLRENLISDPEIQYFILENASFQTKLTADATILKNFLKNPKVQKILQDEPNLRGPAAVLPAEKVESKEERPEDDEYVEMFDIAIQVNLVPKQESTASQTAQLESLEALSPPEKPIPKEVSEIAPVPCTECSKYTEILSSIRRLIEKERRQVKVQEGKLRQKIEALNNNLKLVQSEAQHDLEAHKEEIRDLRLKLRQSSEKAVAVVDPTVSDSVDLSSMAKSNNAEITRNLLETYPIVVELESRSSNAPRGGGGGAEGNTASKSILETIIGCLQNCLKQKDEALAEYRQMMDDMRKNYTSQAMLQANGKSPPSESKHLESRTVPPRPTIVPSPSSEFETLYQELFLKPCSQQNEELLSLLQKAFAELNQLRNNSTHQIETLKLELEKAHTALSECKDKLEKKSKECSYHSQQVTLFQDKEKVYLEKIDSLNTRIADLSRRTVSATNLKKKVDNAVFQESADLRSKVSELTGETKRLELDRWNLEKKLSSERATARAKAQEREHLIGQLEAQIEKYQTVVTKLEKRQHQKVPPPVAVQGEVASKKPELTSCGTQTAVKVPLKVRFQDEGNQAKVPEQRTIVIERHQHEQETFLERREEGTGVVGDREAAATTPAVASPAENQQMMKLKTAQLIEELQSMLEQSLKREKMASMAREISTVGSDVLRTTTTTTSELKTTSESLMSATEVYEQLIDMQFERLVSENAQLKIKLKMSQLVAGSANEAASLVA